MKVTLFASIFLFGIICGLSHGADPECKYRKIRGLSLHWPNPTDCGRYYRCTNRNVKREIICPQGKVYNNKNGKCVTRRRGICKLSLVAPLAARDNICTDVVDGAFLAQPGYCRNYYICHNKNAYPQVCPERSFFNVSLAACIPDTNSTCWQNKCAGHTNGTYLVDSTSCTSFYVCLNNQTVKQSCSTGSFYNASADVCQPDVYENECWENYCLSQPNGIYIPNYDNCRSFYVCYNKKPVAQNCAENSYFDKYTLTCQPGNCTDDEETTECPGVITTTPCEVEEIPTTTPCGVEEIPTTTPCGVEETTTPCAVEEIPTTTPCVVEETTTPCIVEETTTPCIVEEIPTTTPCEVVEIPTTTPCGVEETTTPCVVEETTTPCVVEETTTPCAVEEIPTTTPCIVEEIPTTTPCEIVEIPTTTPCVVEETTTPCVVEEIPTTTPCAVTPTTTECAETSKQKPSMLKHGKPLRF